VNNESNRPQSAADARAEVEARRHSDRDALNSAFIDRYGDTHPGRSMITADAVATGIFTVAACGAALAPDQLAGVYFAVSCLWFLAGSVLFVVAMMRAAERSRTEAIGIGGLFFMAGSAPMWARRALLGLLGAQVVVALTAAAIRPFTPLAFGTLAPVLGLGFCGWWTARYGVFGARGSH